jgi:hypothetical protein
VEVADSADGVAADLCDSPRQEQQCGQPCKGSFLDELVIRNTVRADLQAWNSIAPWASDHSGSMRGGGTKGVTWLQAAAIAAAAANPSTAASTSTP